MLRTFRIGGIHPPENKLSAGKKITALAAPKQVIIPLSQHIGAPAQAVVKKGDLVKVGTLVAKAGGFVSANIHSSVSGKVNKIDNALDSSGYKRPAIYIDVEGDEWEETIDRSDALVKDCTLSSKEIVDKIAAAGIVGLGHLAEITKHTLHLLQGGSITGIEPVHDFMEVNGIFVALDEGIEVFFAALLEGHNTEAVELGGIENLFAGAGLRAKMLLITVPSLEHQTSSFCCIERRTSAPSEMSS